MGKHDADVTAEAQDLLDEKLREIEGKKFEMVYVDRGDGLDDEQIAKLLAGGSAFDDPHFDNWYNDARWEGWKYIKDDLLTVDEQDLLERADLLDELRYAVEERDTSNPEMELLRMSGHKLMRVDLDFEVPWIEFADGETISDLADDIITHLGIETTDEVKARENRAEILMMLNQAPYGGNLQVIFYDSPEDVLGAKRIVFDNPHIVILDRLNGSGMDGKIVGEVGVDVKPGDVVLDSQDSYGWDDIAGVVHSAYAPDGITYER